MIEQAKSLGVRVCLFMDPLPDAMRHAAVAGADRVELYTEPYAKAFGTPAQAEMLACYAATAQAALRVGMGVNAGHDLNRHNLATFLSAVPGVSEVSIGHALIGDSLEFGLGPTVRLYQAEIRTAEAGSRHR
jgi:pyridoxine 5-phosphate synthase